MIKQLRRKLLLKTPIFEVTDYHLIDPHGDKIRRILVETGGASVVMPVDEQGRILLVRQYRHPVRDFLWELPAGKIDEGETPLQAAKRELKEETGYRARRWKKLITYFASPGFLKEQMSIFLATGLTAGESAPDHGEENLELKWFTRTQIEDHIRKGKIRDGKTMLGMYLSTL